MILRELKHPEIVSRRSESFYKQLISERSSQLSMLLCNQLVTRRSLARFLEQLSPLTFGPIANAKKVSTRCGTL